MKEKAYKKTCEMIKAAGKEVPETLTLQQHKNLVMWFIQRYGIGKSAYKTVADELVKNPLYGFNEIFAGVKNVSWDCPGYGKV